MNTFSERFQHLASLKKIFQADVVAALNKDRGAVSRWWNGENVPGPKNMSLIADYFGCDLEWLATGNGDPYHQQKTETAEHPAEFQKARRHTDFNNKLARMERAVFKTQCPGYFDELFEFVADNYGEDKEGVDLFLAELYKTHSNFRVWLEEKKLASEGGPLTPLESTSANDKK